MIEVIKEALGRSHSYKEYREIITALLAEGKSTGNQQSEDLLHYTALNETRMNRLEKTLSVSGEIIQKIQKLKVKYTWLLISEGWCGDSAQLVPVIEKLADVSDNIDLRIVFRDENEDLMNLFLTNGGKSIPKLIVLDQDLNVHADWGPRPQGASDLIKTHKAAKGQIDEEAKTALQLWYLHDKGISTQDEIITLMNAI